MCIYNQVNAFNEYVVEILQVHVFAYLHQIDIFLHDHTHLVSTMGCALEFQSIDIQKSKRSPLTNMDLVWTNDVQNGGAHIIKLNVHISHMCKS